MRLKEEKVIREQLVKNMIYNFIIFTLIFTVFGILIFNTVKNFIYESSNRELILAKQRITNLTPSKVERIEDNRPSGIKNKEEKGFLGMGINPRITYIVREENGTILNTDRIGRIYEEYKENIAFDSKLLNKIYEIKLGNTYTYRGITIKVEQAEQTHYVQFLINVDAEKAIMNNYCQVLVIGIGITIMLSILASYLLSKKALTPIIKSWKKQTEFVQNASHELRTPLTIIQAKQELLLQEPESKIIDKSEEVMLTLNETKRLTKMTKELMMLARADSQESLIQKEEIELDSFIQNIIVPYAEIANMQEKKLHLELEYKTNILVDPDKLHELFVILLDNAINYTKEKDSITLHTYEKENRCIIEIKDTGIGISDEGLKHVFERFYREDKARSRKTGGSGLGLAIAQYLVQIHKGTIKITHNEPRGTVVTIRFPKGGKKQ